MSIARRNRAHIERQYGAEMWPRVIDHIESLKAAGETNLSRAVSAIERADEGDTLAYREFYARVTETLAREAIGFEADAIVELGAGWGRNLFRMWLAGAPQFAEYVALEITEAGRAAAILLHTLSSHMRLRVEPIDLTDPEPMFSFGNRVMVFTCFAVAELPRTPPRLLEFMRSLGAQVRGIHIEPHDTPHARAHDYNIDFWSTMAVRAPVIRQDDLFASPDPQNPCGLLVWQAG